VVGTQASRARRAKWLVDLDPVRQCRFVVAKSARDVNEDCYQVPAEQILQHHVCMSDRLAGLRLADAAMEMTQSQSSCMPQATDSRARGAGWARGACS
jgi:hypothetical protein